MRMTIKEVAKAFDMSVKEFAEYTGYSRQALYQSTFLKCEARGKATIQLLRLKSLQMLAEEKKTADSRFNDRHQAITALENEILQEWNGGRDD